MFPKKFARIRQFQNCIFQVFGSFVLAKQPLFGPKGSDIGLTKTEINVLELF